VWPARQSGYFCIGDPIAGWAGALAQAPSTAGQFGKRRLCFLIVSKDSKTGACATSAALSRLARRRDSGASITDLSLPASGGERLRAVAEGIRGRESLARGFGASEKPARPAVLFSGPPGSGRAAAALANELGLSIYRVEPDRLTGKYIGETEKNLQAVFDIAEREGAVLLFDEADALFGERTDVKDSHDRCANLETGDMLQRIESHPGLVILTSKRIDSIDEAVLRRLAEVIDFGDSDSQARHGDKQRRVGCAPGTGGGCRTGRSFSRRRLV